MAQAIPNHYQTLGLDPDCTPDDVKAAFRFLVKENHPDLHPRSAEAREKTRALNEAYETLSNATRRQDYDKKLRQGMAASSATGRSNADHNIAQDVHLPIEQLLRGTRRDVRVSDPGNADQIETYEIEVPPMTAPNAKLRVPRSQNIAGGILTVRFKPLPDYRFRARGSDLLCELLVPTDVARNGGHRSIVGPLGDSFELEIPPNVARGELFKIEGEGLAKARGGRGNILVRLNYRPGVRVDARD